MSGKTYKSLKYQTGRLSHKIEEDGKKSWLRRPKLYKRVVESYKKKNSAINIRKDFDFEKRIVGG